MPTSCPLAAPESRAMRGLRSESFCTRTQRPKDSERQDLHASQVTLTHPSPKLDCSLHADQPGKPDPPNNTDCRIVAKGDRA
jgi:hypothetical protein